MHVSFFRFIVLLLLAAPWVAAQNVPGRYIVELSTEPVAAAASGKGLRSAAAVSHRARVIAEQSTIRRRIESGRGAVLESLDTVANALVVQLPEGASAAELAAIPGVRRVHPVRVHKRLLDRAVLLHNVNEVWNQVGDDKAGSGIKVAVIDTGIEIEHPAFQDSSLQAPAGFPKSGSPSDAEITSGKVIVARSYVGSLPDRDPDTSARDRVGHGTAIAAIIAGVRNNGPFGSITGFAPKAWLGNYKVFGTPGFNDSTTSATVMKAMDDAVADGMDVLSISIGSTLAPRLADDPEVAAVERATRAGVIVVIAAGNDGDDLNTIASPGTAPAAITVGASTNDRTFAPTVVATGLGPTLAFAGNGPVPSAPVTAPFADVAVLDGNGRGCLPYPSASLTGKIALIIRGECTFELKLNNAQRAGAVAGVVYATAEAPDPFVMGVGGASLPAMMIANEAGVAIKQALTGSDPVEGTLRFELSFAPMRANQITTFSGSGPSVDFAIKPDLVAVGQDVYMATQTFDRSGDMFSPEGYILADGTSFATPMVAGAAALLKAARPGLTVEQYRSLIINSAAPLSLRSGGLRLVQTTGAGLLDAAAALRSTIVANPTSLAFGIADGTARRTLTLTNLGQSPETFTVSAEAAHGTRVPDLSASTIQLDAGASIPVDLTWGPAGLDAGTYDGFITITANSNGGVARVPYWSAVPSTDAARITVLDQIFTGRRGVSHPDAIVFRITDAAGLPLKDAAADVTITSGTGRVVSVRSADFEVPGSRSVDLVLGPGTNVFQIVSGALTLSVTISGT